jgi:hypothetical protein
MSDQSTNTDVNIPLGIPFVGGSDDPSDLIGTDEENNDESQENGDPGV